MGSPITLSGFNTIDFNAILNALMTQERLPVTRMESAQKTLQGHGAYYATLATKLGALEDAASSLAAADAVEGTSATVSDSARLAVTASGSAAAGTYEVVVEQLAKAQVTTSSTVYADADTTVVADRGSVIIGGVQVSISGDVTLQGLASAINGTADIGVVASVVHGATGYRLMLTGNQTGAAHAFTITNNLKKGPGQGNQAIAFNSTADQAAQDARARFNNVTLTSATNRFDAVLPGVSFTTLKADASSVVILTITASSSSVKSMIDKVVNAFRDVSAFLTEQLGKGDSGIGRDAMVRGLRGELSSVLNGQYAGGSLTSLAQIGFEFTRSGELTLDESKLEDAFTSSPDALKQLFRGTDGTGGVFGSLVGAVQRYTQAGGLVPNARDRIDAQVDRLTTRMSDFEARLAVRREALQREFIAADRAMAQLNSLKSQLSSLGSQYSLF